ncbi:hypothetical protein [Pseudomonas sp. EMN2]|uniref:hypothetical protein n=1 Tax=Pseudomonas sp. EMN2 TaxID=2615212 RepID=UPI00129B94FA|nr:hypothetical protein [Pseudomonas sp. EMN2]
MQLNEHEWRQFRERAEALSARLEAANQKVLDHPSFSRELKDAVVKMALPYAIILSEVEQGLHPKDAELIQSSLDKIDQHCHIIEQDQLNAA